MGRLLLFAALLILASAVAGRGEESTADVEDDKAPPEKTVCELIDEAAAAHDLPVDFFTRLIWKESTFRPNAVSPKGAQGIAQFMPATAARRGLADPFDPVAAIPASAHYLKDLAGQFGNLGLAAAAYNAGEERVSDWLAGNRGLPRETRDYVLAITGRTADDWTAAEPEPEPAAVAVVTATGDADDEDAAPAGCAEIAALLSKPGAGSLLVSRIPRAEWAPWGVQVAGNFSVDRALASYAALQDRHAALLGGRAPMVVSTVKKSRGSAPLYEVRVPAETRDEADRLCADLRAAGGACVVLKSAR